MYTFSLSTIKRHQCWSRFCLKSCALFHNISPQNVPNNQKPKQWWKKSLQKIFGRYLLLTNTISAGVLLAFGDLLQQEIEYVKYGDHKKSFDWKRNMNMGIVGTFQGSLAHFFYQILDKYFPGVQISTVMKKILLDQTIASPVFILLFFGGMNYLGNADFEKSTDEIKKKFWVVYAVDCSVWIPAQFINFYCLSSKYRVIYINALTMCYNIFLSFIKHVESYFGKFF